MWRFAECVAKSGLAPTSLQTPQAILVAMQLGAELGLTPMASLRNVAVINGRPSVWGDAQLALCRRSGKFDEDGFAETFEGSLEAGTLCAQCQVKRTDSAKRSFYSFSTADAKLAGLWGKGGPWTQYPKRMLRYRARAFALRDAFTDVLFGFLTAEEAQDLPPREVVSEVTEPKLGTEATLKRIQGGSDKLPEPEKVGRREPERPFHTPEETKAMVDTALAKNAMPRQKQPEYDFNLGARRIAELMKEAAGLKGRRGRLSKADEEVMAAILKDATGVYPRVCDMPMDATMYENTIEKLEARVAEMPEPMPPSPLQGPREPEEPEKLF